MMNKSRWERLGRVLHRLSYLKIGFYGLGFYYEFQTFFGSRERFVHHLCSMLLMFGLAMLLEALRDNELVAEKRSGKSVASLGKHQSMVAVAVVAFVLVVLLGLFCLYYVGDKFQGEAILTFGIGGLALFRLEYDCLTRALSLREKRMAPAPVPVEAGPASAPAPSRAGAEEAQEIVPGEVRSRSEQ